MSTFEKYGRLLSAALLAITIHAVPATAQEWSASVCKVVIFEETTELEDLKIAADLARSNFAAYERIFEMIEGLWEAKTIPRMDYVKAKYDWDAAKLELERANLILERKAALVSQFRMICGDTDSEGEAQAEAVRKEYLRYRRADCDALVKAVEVAATNLEFNREYLTKILELRQENFATHTQVVLAELDVELEEKKLADAKRRTMACRQELAESGARATPSDAMGVASEQ